MILRRLAVKFFYYAGIMLSVSGLSEAAGFGIDLRSNETYQMDERFNHLNLFCHRARPFTYFGVFASARVEFIVPPTSFDLYEGQSEAQVKEEYDNSKPNWLPLVPWRSNVVQFPAFETKCIGITSRSAYSFRFRTFTIDYSRFLGCVASLVLFFNARRLVHSRTLFYSGGVSLGVLASLLIIVYIVGRLVPRKKTMLAVLLMGWSFSVYIFHEIWTNLYEVLTEYRAYVMAYVGLSAMISAAICYRSGPPTNPKTVDLMQWLIQFVSLAGVYLSSDIQEMTLAICVVALAIYNVPAGVSAKTRTWICWKIFKPKVKLLTEEEFYRQGDEVTRLELDKLRSFAKSPSCDAWKIMGRLKNPQRFGSFVLGESHLNDDEILEYETTDLHDDQTFLTDDESEEEAPPRALQVPRNTVTSTTPRTNGDAR